MRIAQVATLSTPVRPKGSGSIESLVWVLTRELTRLGHEVTVFAAAGSETDGETVAALPGAYGTNGSPGNWQLCEWINLCRAVEESKRFDVIHSHNYLYGIPLQTLSRAPMVHTTHLLADEEAAQLRAMNPQAFVTAVSRFQWGAHAQFPPAPVIYHGVDSSQFTFRPQPDDYLCFLGRFTPGKGALEAIEVAKALGLRLILAGPRNAYYDGCIAPLVDGEFIEYVGGGVGGAKRDELLGGARVLLYPIREPEPFGLVMVEAMMCGTPVAALSVGAVPEVVDEGVTGCCAESAVGFSGAVRRALKLDRRRVRKQAEGRFSADRMAREYEQVYDRSI